MKRIGLVYNPLSETSATLAEELEAWLLARGLEVWRGTSQDGREHVGKLSGYDLLVALGGDGTVLRAARLSIACSSVPVLAVALGHLSFMAELRPEEIYNGLETLLAGGGWRDERTLLEATISHDDQPDQTMLALNEVIVARGEINRVVIVDVELYGGHLTTYHADGIIIATATGSTAYALSAGGPIIDPRSPAMALVPIAAHLTTIPSLVLHEDAEVVLRLQSRHPAAFSADGRDAIPLQEGDVVTVRRAKQTCPFARVYPPSTFYERLARRLSRPE